MSLQPCPTLCNSTDHSPPGSSVHGILQARIQSGEPFPPPGDRICLLQFSCSVMSDSSRPHGLQHARTLCPSPTPRVYSNSSPLSRWYHPTISSSVIPFSHLQSFPASGSFQMSQLFASGGQRIGASASASVLPMNIQDWFPLGWTDLISLHFAIQIIPQTIFW